ncbi:MAG: DNA double-strand break repair nuclease NurA [Candidatus Dependentiae bacterium]|nr:DNA double-strand break repair nuclease NurA [Candidatus Dependentiae bacterium]
MLNHQELVAQLDKVSKDLCVKFARQKDIARQVWDSIKDDQELCKKLQSRKWSMLVPSWNGLIGFYKNIESVSLPYAVLAVDGSQIYYDKHQGPACYLINVGSVLLRYGSVKSSVEMSSQPLVIVSSDSDSGSQTAEVVNSQREEFELKAAVEKSTKFLNDGHETPFICLFDGTLIFSNVDVQGSDEKQNFLQSYFQQLHELSEKKIVHAGYISFPRAKELVNVLKIVLSQYDENNVQGLSVLDGLTDMDVASYFLKPGQRSTVFQSKSPVVYAYPKHLKPYFCYMHVGFEIVRLEFPQWIACDQNLVDFMCSVALDQAQKGKGYPVCLFEAHEQAVIKAMDREFFYIMIQKMTQKYDGSYQSSCKSMKKAQVPM